MKCAYHSQKEAIGVCSNCGRGLCSTCKLELGGRLYCQSCANEAFINSKKSKNYVSNWYYLLPVFLGFVGGIIAYYGDDNYKKDKKKANNMLGLGILLWLIGLLMYISL